MSAEHFSEPGRGGEGRAGGQGREGRAGGEGRGGDGEGGEAQGKRISQPLASNTCILQWHQASSYFLHWVTGPSWCSRARSGNSRWVGYQGRWGGEGGVPGSTDAASSGSISLYSTTSTCAPLRANTPTFSSGYALATTLAPAAQSGVSSAVRQRLFAQQGSQCFQAVFISSSIN